MPWSASGAHAATHKASTPKLKRQWSAVANSALKRTGDEGLAKREANGVVAQANAYGPRVNADHHG